MSKTIQGIYRNGQIEFLEEPAVNIKEGPVLVIFLETGEVGLKDRGISEVQAAALRANLGPFAEDWDSPEMRIYDDYDRSKSSI